MLNWPSICLFLTFGIGGMSIGAGLSFISDYCDGEIPFWLNAFISLTPFLIFLLFVPDQWQKSHKPILISQIIGALWYIAASAYVILKLKAMGYNGEYVALSVVIVFGYIPIMIMASKLMRKGYLKK